jgi:epoxyqueuosine reductase
MPPEIFSNNLTELALSMGFSHIGVIKPGPLREDYDRLISWLSSGFQAGMEYLERPSGLSSRADPSAFFPEARSILVLGMRYPVDRLEDTHAGLVGKVSSYAWGRDYHEVIKERLDLLAKKITSLYGGSNQIRIAIDSSPILEKPIARDAGMGWIGRHSCLIHPVHGSFFFLSNVFTSLDVGPAISPCTPRCGTCHRCVDACPTGCIQPDRTIDARRCISYLTIENKGAIPLEMRDKIGQRLFGCDVCQSVCPWNRKPDDSLVLQEFLPKSEGDIWLGLSEVLKLSDQEFKVRFNQSPIFRAKRWGLLRNACVALGNTHSDEAIPMLSAVLQNEPDPIVRQHAAWGLGQVSTKDSRQILSNCRKTELDQDVLDEIHIAMEKN